MIDHDELRMCFAMFAMGKMNWLPGTEAKDAKDCWKIADAMIAASKVTDGGIASIKPKETKNVPQ